MAKKQKSPEKIFLEKFKLYFSSLSSRMSQYAYFNVAENTIILSNSTSGTSTDHGDRLMDFSVPELGLHLMEFKDTEFFNQIVNALQIPRDRVFCIHVLNVLSLLGKHKLDEFNFFFNEYGDWIMQTENRKTYEKKNVIGFPVINFHLLKELHRWYLYLKDVSSDDHMSKYPYTFTDVDVEKIDVKAKTFFLDVDSSVFKDKEGKDIFVNVRPNVRVLCFDGLSCVSISEFIKKVIKKEFTFKLYSWVINNSYVLSMTLYEDDIVAVRSIRPNVLAIPVSDNVVFDPSTNLLIDEDE